MARISFGNKALASYTKRYRQEIIREVRQIVMQTANLIQAETKALAPVDSSNLRGSIEVTFSRGGLSAEITVGAHYAIYVEYGTGIYATAGSRAKKIPWSYFSTKLGRWVTTSGMSAQPFWFPALETGRKYFYDALDKLF